MPAPIALPCHAQLDLYKHTISLMDARPAARRSGTDEEQSMSTTTTKPRGRHFFANPGPTNIPDSVLRALDRPSIDFHDPEFVEVYDAAFAGVKRVLQTRHHLFMYNASGHGAWEASLTNLLSPGDTILVLESDTRRGDLIACVMSGIYTDVEKTLIEIQQHTIVQQTRNTFQNTMQDKFINTVQDLTGRNVMAFISNHHVGPDVEIELFFLTPDTLNPQDPMA